MDKIIASIMEYTDGKVQIVITADDIVQIALAFGERYDIKTEKGKHWINWYRDGHWSEFCVDEYKIQKDVQCQSIQGKMERNELNKSMTCSG